VRRIPALASRWALAALASLPARAAPPLLLALAACATVPPVRTAAGPDGPFPRAPSAVEEFPAPDPSRPWVAIVIDDLGDSPEQVAPFLEVQAPLSFAVLPHAARAADVARSLSDLGRDVLAHVPMEPAEAGLPLPPGTLMTGMDAAAIRAASDLALARVPRAIGANNHMGSAFTRNAAALRPFAEVLHARGMFFLDSRTDAGTVAEDVMTAARVPSVRRTVFLDNSAAPAAIDAMLVALRAAARARGCAVAIGHPRPATVEALRRFAADPARDVEIVPVSSLLGRNCATALGAGY